MQYAATIFLSSFLLFLVQPLIARLILPWFGGSAAVWTTCMLFFQVVLLAGYAYAHFLSRKVSGRAAQAAVHTVLLAASVALLPIAPDAAWKPAGGEEPIVRILLLLGATVGLPYFLLASTSPLVQAWFARERPGANPYRLFALSNLASLGALVGYPFVVEPFFAAREQVLAWSWLFAGFALLCASLAWRSPSLAVPRQEAAERGEMRYGLWLALSATGSALLLAITNHITQNIAAVPLLWLAPLTLYLLSFILTFEGGDWYRPSRLWLPVVVATGAMGWLLADARLHFELAVQLGVFLAGLLVACLFCHGELYRLRPPSRNLTAFYLTVSAGGALGGLLVAVVAPLVFSAYYELGAGLVALGVLAAARFRPLGRLPHLAALAALLGVTGCAVYDALSYRDDVKFSSRSFYGVLRVKEHGRPGEPYYLKRLMHGAILHGEQYQTGEMRRLLTTYYEEESGIGAAIQSKEDHAIKVGVIGLGTGTIAAYGRKGDVYRFYDIDPHVAQVARSEFSFLADSAARVEVTIGDARLALEREAPQGFDVLAVDAFSGDAIPVHLITREALALYLRHMKPDGIVAFHVSNRFLRLVPVVTRIAAEEGAHAVLITDDSDHDETDPAPRARTDWVLVSRSQAALAVPRIVDAGAVPAQDEPSWRTWTDDYSNLVQILK